MSFLVDTISCYAASIHHPMNAITVQALTTLRGQGEAALPQNLIEFWCLHAPTRMEWLGRTPEEAKAELAELKTFFPCCSISLLFIRVERLVSAYAVRA